MWLSSPPASIRYVKQQHLIDVTEIFVFLVRKKIPSGETVGLLAVFFVMVVFRVAMAIFESFLDDNDDFHSF